MRKHPLDHPVSYRAILLTVRFLPHSVCRLLGKVVSLLVYLFSSRDRKGLSANLSLALSKPVNHPEIRKIVRKIFINYGQYLVDFFLLPLLPNDKARRFFNDLDNSDTLKRALSEGRGAILITAHLGNWEIGSILLRDYNTPFNVVAAPHNTSATNSLVRRLREKSGVRVIEINDSPFAVLEMLNRLRKNEIIAVIGDRDLTGNGWPVKFFGRKVLFPPGPVILAMKSGTPLIPIFVVKSESGRYSVAVENPVPMDFGDDKDVNITVNLNKVARVFEKYIRRYPDQWYSPDPISGTLPEGSATCR